MKRFGVMLDCSRNAVMKVEEVKKFASLMRSFGYNMLQLYTEDTYQVDGEPYFGYMRGRYTKEELKEIVAYCNSIGMEVIPCIQTLAHLNQIFRWGDYGTINDCNDILFVGEERTYQFIENMVKSVRECFTSGYVHIGMDEAFMLGTGKYLKKHGQESKFDILYKHLLKVIEIVKKYGFHPIMWSDMFFRACNDGAYYPENPVMPKEIVSLIPKEVELVYWDYYHTEQAFYDKMMDLHKQMGETWFTGGAWTWSGFAPSNQYTIDTMLPAMRAARNAEIDNVMIAMWGDDGKECSFYGVLPSLFASKKFYDGEFDMDKIKAEFEQITGEKWDAFMALDKPNTVGGCCGIPKKGPAKSMLYTDLFMGLYDSTVKDGVAQEYADLALELKGYAKDSKFAYLFEAMAALCDALSVKYDLGVRTRKAYQSNDKAELKLILGNYKETLGKIETFYNKYQQLWFTENKPHGFDVQDIRLGALMQRVKACTKRLEAYLGGEIQEIPELQEELLDYFGGNKEFGDEMPRCSAWRAIITANVLG